MHASASSDHLSSLQCFIARSDIFAIILSSTPIFCMSAFETSMLLAIALSQSPPPFFLQPKAARESAATSTHEILVMPHSRKFSIERQPVVTWNERGTWRQNHCS